MKTLDELLSDLARRGELTHLSVAPSGKTFLATYAPARAMGLCLGEDADPAKAIRAALCAKPHKQVLCADSSKPTEDEMDFG